MGDMGEGGTTTTLGLPSTVGDDGTITVVERVEGVLGVLLDATDPGRETVGVEGPLSASSYSLSASVSSP